ncbi:hypothetical protein O181_022163 [Austropuccinia psidii MF-1]|uniref:Secreted protein n=1 Tax=Austropuccinia psidii MF-1 TaxID=1389203 RepID=A0A9Q3CEN7_9BASI|nr:hypothetical protein [Austropuccinia psidii MF-1]
MSVLMEIAYMKCTLLLALRVENCHSEDIGNRTRHRRHECSQFTKSPPMTASSCLTSAASRVGVACGEFLVGGFLRGTDPPHS